METDNKTEVVITPSKYLTFYQKYSVQIWAFVFGIVGLFGGNVDRLEKFVPAVVTSQQVTDKLEDLEVRTQINTESIDSINKQLSTLNDNVAEAIKEAKTK